MFDVTNMSTTEFLKYTADLSTWWQSVTWQHLGERPVVTITLSFGKLYQLLDDIDIVFQSARPRQMTLLKSVDFGRTWSPLQYFYRSCRSVVLTIHYSL